MIKVNFKECCNSCANLDVYTDISEMCAGDVIIIEQSTVIGCKHEKVCGLYLSEGVKNGSVIKLVPGNVYEIVNPEFMFKYPLGGDTNQYARGILIDCSLSTKKATLTTLHDGNTVTVAVSDLKEV